MGAPERGPAARRSWETGEPPTRRRLSAPALADGADRLALAELQRDVVDRRDGPGARAVGTRDAVELDEGDGHASFSATGASASEPSAAATACQRMHAASWSRVSTASNGGGGPARCCLGDE